MPLSFPTYDAVDLIAFDDLLVKAAVDGEARITSGSDAGQWTAGGGSGSASSKKLSPAKQKELATLNAELSKVRAKIAKLKGSRKGEIKSGKSTGGAKTKSTASSAGSGKATGTGSSTATELTKLEAEEKTLETKISAIQNAA